MGSQGVCERCGHSAAQHEQRVSAANTTGCGVADCSCRGLHTTKQINASGESMERRPATTQLERRG